MVLFPFLLYPFSQTIWMAYDLMLRPPLAEEFEPRGNVWIVWRLS